MRKINLIIILITFVLCGCDTQHKSAPSSKSTTGNADIEFNITVSGIAVDEIFLIKIYYGAGTYTEAQSEFDKMIKVKSNEMAINSTDQTHGSIKFSKNIEFDTDFSVFYMAELINNQNVKIGNLKQVYQETQKYQNHKSYSVDLTIDGIYGDMNVGFFSHFF